jgi:23S rRNA pseudouridine1911/1915/1917 synthase
MHLAISPSEVENGEERDLRRMDVRSEAFDASSTPFFDVKTSLLFEDNHLFVVNKPAGVLVQHGRSATPTATTTTATNLLDAVKAHLVARDGKMGRAWVGLVHRLDRPTSGVMVFAKTSKAASRLSAAFRARTCTKLYLSVVHGALSASGTLTDYLLQARGGPLDDVFPSQTQVVASDHPGAVSATLHYRPLATFGPPAGPFPALTAVLVALETGRKHQIRAQMAHSGHPIVGDTKYGAPQAFATRDIALHAWSLTVPHPVGKHNMTFTVPPPVVWAQRFGDAAMAAAMAQLLI